MSCLDHHAVEQRLSALQGWRLADLAIQKEYRFTEFMEGIRFVGRVADLAERADHHPDILIRYRRVTLTLTTHSEGGLTEKDFSLAREIDRLAGTDGTT
jgi:4a-hydroxytetrahydrobiopterin dehydratase